MSTIILLADDDHEFLEATSYMLQYDCYNVIGAVNGEDAVNQFQENNPDIVLLDIKMPILDGYEAFFKIKKVDPDATIFFTSSYAIDDEKYQKAKDCGLKGLINKPFELEDVQKLISKYV